MNAALEARRLTWLQGRADAGSDWNEDIVETWRLRDQIAIKHLRAFGRRRRRAGSSVAGLSELITIPVFPFILKLKRARA
jgi:hypothetical protein